MDVYTYTDNNGKKHVLRRVRVSSINVLRRADHVAFPRLNGTYWHHAIVEDIDREWNEIKVIEYSNSARGFTEDNSCCPKRPGLAKVGRGTYQFQTGTVYLIKHEQCLDPNSVISRAESKLGEREYDPFTNNCEHFATWCKVGTSSSEQADEVVNRAINCVKAGLCAATKELFTQTGEEIVKTGVRVTTKEVVTQTVSKAGQEIVKTGIRAASKEVVAQTVSKAGQEVVKTGIRAASKEVVAHTVSKAGQEVVKAGMRTASKEVVAHTVSKAGQEVVKTGIRAASKEVVYPCFHYLLSGLRYSLGHNFF